MATMFDGKGIWSIGGMGCRMNIVEIEIHRNEKS